MTAIAVNVIPLRNTHPSSGSPSVVITTLVPLWVTSLLFASPPLLWAVLDESVLYRTHGAAKTVMRDQPAYQALEIYQRLGMAPDALRIQSRLNSQAPA
jgi:hypothetical protein